ncbi:DUF7709 family protein [Paraherbaspirillum soli]|uniref:DUF7709 domain-containing protein n=1 Tax=Paraherbaspirillum soli TaxID=631222 RepID=A0ABW0MCG7_9BURK
MSISTPENTEQLGSINQKIIADGESLPIVELSDGSKVQTGTVATMLHNVTLYNEGARGAIEKELELSVPTLIKVGLFDLFSPEEWISSSNPGRRFVGEKAKEHLDRHPKLPHLIDQTSI